MKTLLASTLLFVLLAASAVAQNISNSAVEGLMVFKRHGSDADARATAVEYRSIAVYPLVTHVFLPGGVHTRVTDYNDPSFIPYPGRGGYDRATAVAVIDVSIQRYPQYAGLLRKVRQGWLAIPQAQIEVASAASAQRHSWARETVAAISQKASGFVQQTFVSLLGESPVLGATKPVGRKADVVAASSTEEPLQPGTLDLEKNLNILKRYYGVANTLNPES